MSRTIVVWGPRWVVLGIQGGLKSRRCQSDPGCVNVDGRIWVRGRTMEVVGLISPANVERMWRSPAGAQKQTGPEIEVGTKNPCLAVNRDVLWLLTNFVIRQSPCWR